MYLLVGPILQQFWLLTILISLHLLNLGVCEFPSDGSLKPSSAIFHLLGLFNPGDVFNSCLDFLLHFFSAKGLSVTIDNIQL